MNKLQKKYLMEFLRQNPSVKTGKKKKELTPGQKKEQTDRQRQARDRARDRRWNNW